MAHEDHDLKNFQDTLLEVTQIVGFLSNEEAFSQEYGFSMTEYIDDRHSCARKIRGVADDLERIVKDTGIAKTTGGSVAVVSGAAALGGLLLAPFTAGLSLGLTVGGIAGGIASAATSLTASIIKDKEINKKAKEVKALVNSLKHKDEVVGEIIQELQEKIKKLRSLYGKKSVIDFLEDGAKIGMWVKNIGYNIGYKGYKLYSSVKAIRFAKAIAEIIKADVHAMRGIATGMAAPGLGFFGRALIVAGSTTAKVLSGVFSVVGIGFGIWDIVDGAKDINGSKHAKAYRKAAAELDQQTEEYAELLRKFEKVRPDNN